MNKKQDPNIEYSEEHITFAEPVELLKAIGKSLDGVSFSITDELVFADDDPELFIGYVQTERILFSNRKQSETTIEIDEHRVNLKRVDSNTMNAFHKAILKNLTTLLEHQARFKIRTGKFVPTCMPERPTPRDPHYGHQELTQLLSDSIPFYINVFEDPGPNVKNLAQLVRLKLKHFHWICNQLCHRNVDSDRNQTHAFSIVSFKPHLAEYLIPESELILEGLFQTVSILKHPRQDLRSGYIQLRSLWNKLCGQHLVNKGSDLSDQTNSPAIPAEIRKLEIEFRNQLNALGVSIEETVLDVQERDGKSDLIQKIDTFISSDNSIQSFHPDLRESILCTLAEISTCLSTRCYIASLALTGRVVEACLKQILVLGSSSKILSNLDQVTISDLWDEIHKHLALKQLIERANISPVWIHQLCWYRNSNSHDKSKDGSLPSVPSVEQASASLEICIDLLNRTKAAIDGKQGISSS